MCIGSPVGVCVCVRVNVSLAGMIGLLYSEVWRSGNLRVAHAKDTLQAKEAMTKNGLDQWT